MKVLLISPNYPFPADKGDRIRVNSILRALIANNVEVDLFCLEREGRELPEAGLELNDCKVFFINKNKARLRMLMAMFSWTSLTTAFFNESKFTKELQAVDFSAYDKVFICSSCLGFLLPFLKAKDLADKLVWDLIDLDSIKWNVLSSKMFFLKKLIYKRESRRIAAIEEEIIKLVDHSLLITEREIVSLDKSIRYRKKISAIPNSVNPLDLNQTLPQTKKYNLIFTGQMDYFPNMEAVKFFSKQVLPIVRAKLSRDVNLTIGGRNASQKFIKQCPHCRFLGDVEDMSVLVASARVAVVPLLSVFGMPTKTLQAMACGLPLVVTPQVAEALKLEDNRHALVASSAQDFAEDIVNLILDLNLANRLTSEARNLIQNQYSEDYVASLVGEVL